MKALDAVDDEGEEVNQVTIEAAEWTMDRMKIFGFA